MQSRSAKNLEISGRRSAILDFVSKHSAVNIEQITAYMGVEKKDRHHVRYCISCMIKEGLLFRLCQIKKLMYYCVIDTCIHPEQMLSLKRQAEFNDLREPSYFAVNSLNAKKESEGNPVVGFAHRIPPVDPLMQALFGSR